MVFERASATKCGYKVSILVYSVMMMMMMGTKAKGFEEPEEILVGSESAISLKKHPTTVFFVFLEARLESMQLTANVLSSARLRMDPDYLSHLGWRFYQF